MLSHNRAASYRSGAFSQGDGRTDLTTTASGQQILNVGNSNVPVSVNLAEMQSTQLSKQAGISHQKGLTQTESSATNMADTLNNSVDLSNHLAKTNQLNNQFMDGKTIEQTAALNKSAQIVKKFGDDHNLNAVQSAQMLAAASANVGLEKAFSMLTLVGGDAKLSANISGSSDIQNIYRDAQEVTKSQDFQTSLRDASQLSHNQSFAKHDDQGKRLAESLNHSWNESNSLRQEAHKSFTESNNYQEQATEIKNSSASINANYNQQFVDWLAEQPADNSGGGHIGRMGAAHIMTHDPEMAVQYAKIFVEDN